MNLSIIVPVYNVEKYIRSCMESIFRQGLSDDEFEVIVINDGTPDKSMDIIAEFVKTHTNIRVFNQTNQGLSIARNIGLNNAVGEYIAFLDSDDILIDNSLSLLLGKALNSKADLIVANYIEMNSDIIPPTSIVNNENIIVNEKTGYELLLEELNPNDCHVWHTLYLKEFLVNNNISFIPRIKYEDIPFTHDCYLKAKKCLRIQYPMYIYRLNNTNSITSNFSKKSGMDLCIVINYLRELTKDTNYSAEVIKKIKQDAYATFSILTYCMVHDIHSQKDRLEVLRNIKHVIPNLKFTNGIKQIATSFLFNHFPYLYISIRLTIKWCTPRPNSGS